MARLLRQVERQEQEGKPRPPKAEPEIRLDPIPRERQKQLRGLTAKQLQGLVVSGATTAHELQGMAAEGMLAPEVARQLVRRGVLPGPNLGP